MVSLMKKVKYWIIRILTILITVFTITVFACVMFVPCITVVNVTGSSILAMCVLIVFRWVAPQVAFALNKYLATYMATLNNCLDCMINALEVYIENKQMRYLKGSEIGLTTIYRI